MHWKAYSFLGASAARQRRGRLLPGSTELIGNAEVPGASQSPSLGLPVNVQFTVNIQFTCLSGQLAFGHLRGTQSPATWDHSVPGNLAISGAHNPRPLGISGAHNPRPLGISGAHNPRPLPGNSGHLWGTQSPAIGHLRGTQSPPGNPGHLRGHTVPGHWASLGHTIPAHCRIGVTQTRRPQRCSSPWMRMMPPPLRPRTGG